MVISKMGSVVTYSNYINHSFASMQCLYIIWMGVFLKLLQLHAFNSLVNIVQKFKKDRNNL